MSDVTATRLERWAQGLLAYSLFVVLWGAYVRASFSGDGCGDHWPLCHGVVLPNEPSTKTLIELTHRVTSGLALVGAMLLPWLAKRHAPPGTPVQRATRLVLLFMVTEALVGGAIVLLRKVANDLSVARGYWMAAHLVNTFLLLAALVASVYFARPERAVPRTEGRVASRWPFALGLLLMLLTGTTGAVTALGDTLFPAESFQASFAQEFQPGAHPFLRLRVFHPIAALLTAGWLAYVAGTRLEDLGQRGAARTVLALALLQVGLGFVNMLLLAPVWMQLVHLAVADALFMAFVWLALAARGAS
ncbi:MAG: COX15/CtaA family protein [Polyangiales bacterium]|nr:COX15/CtaA family protein [Myxococcales bacterium]MCB9657964.1 COX15/CtaA family protein [Sandaracinaceae bacterium]